MADVKMVQVDKDICGVCGRCVAFCPREALSVTVKWGSLSIDDEECTRCFGGSHHFAKGAKKLKALPGAGPPGWNLICTENCPVGALSAAESIPKPTDGASA
jgi:ferredoxin